MWLEMRKFYFTKELHGFVQIEKLYNSIRKAVTAAEIQREKRETENKYRLLAENQLDVVCSISPQGELLYVSPAVEQFGGYVPEDEEGESIYKYIAEQDRSKISKIFQRIITTNQCPSMVEFMYIPKQGKPFPVEASARPMIENGRLVSLHCVLRDVTERKNMEKVIKDSERRFIEVLYASEDAILLVRDNHFVECNDAAVRMLGYSSKKAFLNTHPSDLSPPVQPDGKISFEKAENMISLAFERGFYRFEWVHRRADGEDFPVEVSLTPVVYKGDTVLYSVWRDITEIKRAKEELVLKSMVLDQIEDLVTITDLKGVITYVNDAEVRALGIPRDDLIGRTTDVYGEDREKSTSQKEIVERTLREGSLRTEVVNYAIDGSRHIMDCRTQVVHNQEGKPVALCGITTDITKRKKIEEDLRESEATVRKKLYAVMDPEGDIGVLELEDIIDYKKIQSMMEKFYELTGIGSAVLDIKGKVLVAVGWQDICTKFHRCHPETLKNCIESDTLLTEGVPPGTYRAYRCKNNLWDIATPITVGDRHLGNIYIGQFFLKDEIPDEDLFRGQARRYGFDETAYMEALHRVPQWSREKVNTAMEFFADIAEMIANLSYGTVKLARALSQKDATLKQLGAGEKKYRLLIENLNEGIWRIDRDANTVFVNSRMAEMLGYTVEEMMGKSLFDFMDDRGKEITGINIERRKQGIKEQHDSEFIHKDGRRVVVQMEAGPVLDDEGNYIGAIAGIQDITARRQAEEALKRNEIKLRRITDNISDVVFTTDMDLNVTYVSPSVEKLLGESPETHMKKTMSEKFTPDTVIKLRNILLEELEKEKDPAVDPERSMIVEVEHFKSDGGTIWVAMNIKFIRDGKGNPIGLQGVSRDIGGLKSYEKSFALQHQLAVKMCSTSSYKEALGNILDTLLQLKSFDCGGIYRVNPDDGSLKLEVFRGVSDSFIKLSSYYNPEAVQANLIKKGEKIYTDYSAICPINEPAVEEEGLKAIAIVPIIHNNNAIASINVASHEADRIDEYDKITLETIAGNFGSAISRIIDEEEKSLLAAIVDNAPGAIIVHRFDGRIIYANSRAFEISGYSREEFLKSSFMDLQSVLTPGIIESQIPVLEEKGMADFKSDFLHKSGSIITFDVTAKVIQWQGEPAILGIATPIAEKGNPGNIDSLRRDSDPS